MTGNYSILGAVMSVLLLTAAVSSLRAADAKTAATAPKAETIWIHPVIAKFGGVHPRPDAAVQPDPAVDYKIFVDVVSGEDDHTQSLASLDRLARLVNLMGFAKVPPAHVHIVALLDEKAGIAALSNATYRERYHTDNPNLPILQALKNAGVELLVCSQALAGQGLADSAVDPSITVTLSALTDPVVYGQRGYTYMQL